MGGILTEYVGWEWVFFVNIPIGLASLALVRRYVHESKAPDLARHFDAWGATTITAGLILLVFGLTRAPTVGWTSPQVILSFVGWAVLTAAAIAIELRSKSPLVPLSIFRRRTLSAANGIGLILGMAVFGMFYLLSLYMQIVLGYSAMETGLGYLAVALTAVVASGVAQALTTKAGVKPVLATGMGLLAAGLVFFTQISEDGSYAADLLPGFFLIGVGLGFAFVPVSIAALAGATGKEAGLASGLINTNQQIGGAIGLAILITISTTRADDLVAEGASDAAALTEAYSLAFWVAAGIAALGVVVTLFALKREELETVEPAEQAAS
jgi:EmrB/QacA subfamily drug resistance transporter